MVYKKKKQKPEMKFKSSVFVTQTFTSILEQFLEKIVFFSNKTITE
jgi:hypothetical protein